MSHFSEYKGDTAAPDGRTLGDEWADWDGRGDEAVRSGKGLFLFSALFVIILIAAAVCAFVYLISPRLGAWNAHLPLAAWVLAAVFISAIFVSYLLLILTLIRGKNLFPYRGAAYKLFDLIFSKTFRLANFFGASRDRIGHSFVKVSNSLACASKEPGRAERLLILLPRCLSKENLKNINDLKNIYPIEIHTVSGGELARKKVKELKPTAVIGVACERDLVSGIRDVGQKILVIGIPNERPEGPCRNTKIDMNELINAIEFFLGSDSHKLPPVDTK